MRVISGSARRLQLKCLEGMETRPTTDRIKETLFNMINEDLYDSVFIDLFAGSGGIGIEALSRGAKCAVFIEKNRKAVNIIEDNLAHTRLADKAQVICADALAATDRLSAYSHIDFVYMDPPYKLGVEKDILDRLSAIKSVDSETLIIIEADMKTGFDFIEDMDYTIERVKNYKTNKHVFLRKN